MISFLRKKKSDKPSYDPQEQKPVIKCSICTGEQVAGFCDIRTGAFTDVCLIRNDADLDNFREQYGITEEIEKIY